MAKLSMQFGITSESQRPTRFERKQRQIDFRKEEAKAQAFQQQLEEEGRIAEQIMADATPKNYKAKYESLPANIKKYYLTPDEYTTKLTDQRLSVIAEVEAELQRAREKQEEEEDKYQERRARYRKKGLDTTKIRQEHNIDNAYWSGYISKLKWGIGELKKGKNYDFKSIKDYADDYGDYKEDRKEAKYERTNLETKYAGEIQELQGAENIEIYKELYKELPKSVKKIVLAPTKKEVKSYYQEKTKYESDVELQKKGLIPIYKDGAIVGYEDAVLQMSYSAEFLPLYEKERTKFDIVYDADTNTIKWKKSDKALQEEALLQQQEWKLSQPTKVEVEPYKEPKPEGVWESIFYYGDKIGDAVWGGLKKAGTFLYENVPLIPDISSPFDKREEGETFWQKIWITPDEVVEGWKFIGEKTHAKDIWESVKPQIYITAPQPIKLIGLGNIISPAPITIVPKGIKDYATTPDSIPLTELTGQYKEWSSEKLEEVQQQKREQDVIKKELDVVNEEFQVLAGERIRYHYGEQLIKEELTPEEATEKYWETTEGKELLTSYEEKYTATAKGTEHKLPWLTKLGYGAKEFIYTVPPAVAGLVDEPHEMALVYFGGKYVLKGLASIPTKVIVPLATAEVGYGTYKVLNPFSESEDIFEGVVHVATGGLELTYAGIKWAGKPVIKPYTVGKTFETPKAIAYGKQVSTKVDDVVRVAEKSDDVVKSFTLTEYPKQTLLRQYVSGHGVIVSTKGRELVRNILWKTQNLLKDTSSRIIRVSASAPDEYLSGLYIYKGVPYEQLGTVFKIDDVFRGGEVIYKTDSAYQKALKKLVKYGYTESQARRVLRYTAPRVYQYDLQGYVVAQEIQGKAGATGELFVTRTQPKLVVDDVLTRGSKATVTQKYTIERAILKQGQVDIPYYKLSPQGAESLVKTYGANVFLEKGTKEIIYKSASGNLYGKIDDYIDDISKQGVAFTDEAVKGYYPRTTRGGITVYDEVDVITSGSITNEIRLKNLGEEIVFTKSGGVQWATPKVRAVGDVTFGKTSSSILIKQQLDNIDDIIVSPSTVRGNLPAKTDDILKPYANWGDDVIVDSSKVDNVKNIIKGKTPTAPISIQKLDKAVQLDLDKLSQAVDVDVLPVATTTRSIFTPVERIDAIQKSILSGFIGGEKSIFSGKTKLRDDLIISPDIETGVIEDTFTGEKSLEGLRDDQIEGMILGTGLRTGTRQTTIQQPVIDITPIIDVTPPPSSTLPKIPPAEIPIIPLWLDIPWGKKKKSDKELKKLLSQNYALLPDFTTRALGLAPKELTVKQAQKEIKKIQTGLGIRRGARLKLF